MNREESKDKKRNNLLDSALSLFIDKGINDTSIQDIANNAGLGKGTFYSYFKDKFQLRNILIAQKANSLFTVAFEKFHQKKDLNTLADKVVFIVDELINELINQPDLLKFVSKDLSYELYRNAVTNIYNNNEKTVLEVFSTGTKSNGEKIKNPKMLLSILLELVCSTSYNSILFSQPAPINEFKPYLYDNIRILINNPNS